MFDVGDKIRFRYTGVVAEILEDYLDGSYAVWIPSDQEESVAFAEDIVLERNFNKIEVSDQQKQLKKPLKGPSTEELFYSPKELEAKRLKAFQKSAPKSNKGTINNSAAEQDEVFSPPPIVMSPPQGLGIFLAFYPTSASAYTIYLVNDTATSFGFIFKLWLSDRVEQGFNKIIPANTFFPIGTLEREQFNDRPSIKFSCPSFNFSKTLKLKYTKFLRQQRVIPLMGIETHGYLIANKLNYPSKTAQPSLQDYTQLQQQEQAWLKPAKRWRRQFNLMDVASFEPELDLHAERLVADTSEFSSAELYTLQLEILQEFIDRAIHLEVREVYIIHGVGKGKLRAGVEQYLLFHDAVKVYRNEFHEKYGFGATYVQLKF